MVKPAERNTKYVDMVMTIPKVCARAMLKDTSCNMAVVQHSHHGMGLTGFRGQGRQV